MAYVNRSQHLRKFFWYMINARETPNFMCITLSISVKNIARCCYQCVVSLSKRHLLPKSTGNTQE